jgi:hypothetical protein
MALTRQDRLRVANDFRGYWRGPDHQTVLDRAHRDYLQRYPDSSVTINEFTQLLDMRGLVPVNVGGGGDRPHDVRLSI